MKISIEKHFFGCFVWALFACNTTSPSRVTAEVVAAKERLVGTIILHERMSKESLDEYMGSGAQGFYFLDTPQNRELIPLEYLEMFVDVDPAAIEHGSVIVMGSDTARFSSSLLAKFCAEKLAQGKADREHVTTALSKYPPGTPGAGLANMSRLLGATGMESPHSAAAARAGFETFEMEHYADLMNPSPEAFRRIAEAEGQMFGKAAAAGQMGLVATAFTMVLPDKLREMGIRFFSGK